MCPYYNRDNNTCKIYKTTPLNYIKDEYCMEMKCDYTECPNYKQCARANGGIAPPPYKF